MAYILYYICTWHKDLGTFQLYLDGVWHVARIIIHADSKRMEMSNQRLVYVQWLASQGLVEHMDWAWSFRSIGSHEKKLCLIHECKKKPPIIHQDDSWTPQQIQRCVLLHLQKRSFDDILSLPNLPHFRPLNVKPLNFRWIHQIPVSLFSQPAHLYCI